MSRIHTTALVDPRAELDLDVEVGAYCVIGPKVKVGRGTRIKSHVVVEGNTTLGEGNVIFQFATVGSIPQDLKYQGEDSQLIIGQHNTIREFVSLNPGTAGGGKPTMKLIGHLACAREHGAMLQLGAVLPDVLGLFARRP
ncbi:MAG: hypothetical protein IH919_07645, partial [Deltaproteobacteria bacterium]|nr:hypothetical protein [Deltaproteobacteria bacterium]